MNPNQGPSASEWLHSVSVDELSAVLAQTCHALDQLSINRVAEELVHWQKVHGGPFKSAYQFTRMLKEGLEAELRVESPNLKLPSLVKTSLRIHLNEEMPQLRKGLEAAFEALPVGGRVCVICFNRWEVSAIRDFVRRHEEPSEGARRSLPADRLVELYPLLGSETPYAVKRVCKPIRPTREELERNQRAKSSLHVLEKVARVCRLGWGG